MTGEASTSVTISRAISEAALELREADVPDPRREASTLLMHALGCNRAFIVAHSDDALDPSDLARFRQFVARRAGGEPLQYIAARQEFYGLDFEVTPDVLIPRPETELLVEQALKLLQAASEPRICDVGTGSGCIGVTLLHERRDARGVALDISPAALRIAERNAARHGVLDRLTLCVSDCFAALDPATERFTLIASNPPYIAEHHIAGLQREVRDHEPRGALTPGGDGLDVVRRLLTDAPPFLVAGGHLIFEIGFDQHEAVRELIDSRMWMLLDIHEDLQGIPRVVVLRRVG